LQAYLCFQGLCFHELTLLEENKSPTRQLAAKLKLCWQQLLPDAEMCPQLPEDKDFFC